VGRRFSAPLAAVLILSVAWASDEMADLRSAAEAMDCCAKTSYECAGFRTPDDCCNQMHQGTSGTVPSTVAAAPNPLDASMTAAPDAAVSLPTRIRRVEAAALDFIRPHDPPHLHTFSLLI
jgi:hypothetical protein